MLRPPPRDIYGVINRLSILCQRKESRRCWNTAVLDQYRVARPILNANLFPFSHFHRSVLREIAIASRRCLSQHVVRQIGSIEREKLMMAIGKNNAYIRANRRDYILLAPAYRHL